MYFGACKLLKVARKAHDYGNYVYIITNLVHTVTNLVLLTQVSRWNRASKDMFTNYVDIISNYVQISNHVSNYHWHRTHKGQPVSAISDFAPFSAQE